MLRRSRIKRKRACHRRGPQPDR